MLEKSVGLDSSFAPAWYELSRRYYVASRYADAGHDTVERYEIAAVRACHWIQTTAAAAFLANSYVERGELLKAYQQDEDLVRRRPDSFQAHFSRSYVLRYAGLLKESASECEISLSLAPSDVPRSCAIVFSLQGDYERAMQFIRLGPPSDFANAMSIAMLLRQGKPEEALRIELPHIPQWGSYDMLPLCAKQKTSPEIATLAANVRASDDPDGNYLSAANLLLWANSTGYAPAEPCSTGNYCSYPAIDLDPFFANVRAMPEFAEIRSAAITCQKVRDGTPASEFGFRYRSVRILYLQMSLSPPREFVSQARASADSCVTRMGLPASDQRESHATGERFDTPVTPVRALSAMKETEWFGQAAGPWQSEPQRWGSSSI
jgi:hypothetical protein